MTDNWCRGGKIVQWITIEIPGCVSIRPVCPETISHFPLFIRRCSVTPQQLTIILLQTEPTWAMGSWSIKNRKDDFIYDSS